MSEGNARLLFVEDDEDLAFGMLALLSGLGFESEHVTSVAAARRVLDRMTFDVALVDLSLPDEDGLLLLEEIALAHPHTGLICLTGRDEASSAVRAMRAGAVDYLTKPVPRERLLRAIEQATARLPRATSGPVGDAPAWRRAMMLIERVAQSPRTTVLLTGEPGVGKEEAASLLHRLSERRDRPMVAINAACLSPGLIESELFGHEAGAFTGAVRQRRGLLEQADGGTLFLDEVGELPLEMQPKLLRLLEGQPFRRVGGDRPISVDVRLVTATNQPLDERVRSGAFRADLLERLRVFEIPLPPLRERPGDIAMLASHFLSTLSGKLGRLPPRLSLEALQALEAHPFPGNVRELRNLIERALVLADGTIEPRHLPPSLARVRPAAQAPAAARALPGASLEDVTRSHILSVYERNGCNVTQTALELGMSRLAVRKRLQSYGVRQKNDDKGR